MYHLSTALGAMPSDAELTAALELPTGSGVSAALAKWAATLDGATKQQLMDRFKAALPSCWGARSQHCVDGTWDAVPVWERSRCRDLANGYVADYAGAQALVSAVPNCDEEAPMRYALIAGGVGLTAGALAAWLLLRR